MVVAVAAFAGTPGTTAPARTSAAATARPRRVRMGVPFGKDAAERYIRNKPYQSCTPIRGWSARPAGGVMGRNCRGEEAGMLVPFGARDFLDRAATVYP